MKYLIAGASPTVFNYFTEIMHDCSYLDLRRGYETNDLMDIYEVVQPDLCATVRDEIIAQNPDVIIVVGALEGYVWLGTIVTRLFGQFNSWNGQRENQWGETTITVNNKPVRVVALYNPSDWGLLNEKSN